MDTPAVEAPFVLLVGRQRRDIHDAAGSVWPIGAIASGARYRTGHQTAIVTPGEVDPGGLLRRLILQVRGLVELLVVVDTEYADRAGSRANTRDLGTEE